MDAVDCREEIVNKILLWASAKGIDIEECRYDIDLILNGVEIIKRCTEIAPVQVDRNEMLLKKFLVAKQVKGCTKKTLQFYAVSIKSMLERMEKTVDDITADDIRYYMAVRLRRDKVSKTTIGNEIRNLGSFFRWLYMEEEIRKNPMLKIDRIKQRKTKKEALTELEIEKLRAAADGEREKMLIELLLSTGCRVSEVAQILVADIDGDRILVHGKGEKDRYVYLNAKAKFTLEKYLEERRDSNPYLLPHGADVDSLVRAGVEKSELRAWWKNPENIREGHSSTGSIEAIMRKIAKRAGVEKANPHKYRRTCATMALRRGMPLMQVSKMLGHENVSTTQIYLDLSEDELEQAHKKYVI